MVGLIYKELVLQKRGLIILGITYIIFLALLFFPMSNDYAVTLANTFGMEANTLIMIWIILIYIITFLVLGMYQPTIFETDESRKWADFITSTPLTENGQIAAKYGFTLLLSVILLAFNWGVSFITAIAYDADFYFVDLLVLLFYIQLLLRAFEYPFIVRFGSKNGGIYKGFLFLLIVLAVILYLLFGDLSAFGSINGIVDWLFDVIMVRDSSGTMMTVQASLPFVSILCYAASYKLSDRLYKKGVENYVK